MSVSRVKYGQAYVEITGDDNKLTKALKSSINNIRKFGQKARAVGASISKIGLAIAGVAAVAVTSFAKMGDELEKLSRKTGASVEWLSKMKFAATQSGTSLEGMGKAMKRMAATIYDAGQGLSTATDALAEMGMTVADLQGLSPEKQFELLADSLSKVQDASTRAALAQRIFGRAGVDLLPLIENGAKGLNAFAKEAERLGIVMSAKDAKAAADLADEFDRMMHSAKMAVFQIGAALAPTIQDIASKIRGMLPGIREWIADNKDMIITVAKLGGGILALGLTLATFGNALVAIAGTMKLLLGLGPKIAAMFTFLMAHPAIAVAAAIAAVGIAIGLLIKSMKAINVESQYAVKIWGDLYEAQKKVAEQAKASAEAASAEVESRINNLKSLEQQLADVMKKISMDQLSTEDKKIQKAKDLLAARLKLVQAARDEQKALKLAEIEAAYQKRRAARAAKSADAAGAMKTAAEAITSESSPERNAAMRRISDSAFEIMNKLKHEEFQDMNDTRRAKLRVAGGDSILDQQESVIREAGQKDIAAQEQAKVAAIRAREYAAAKKRGMGVDVGGILGKAKGLLGTVGGALSGAADTVIGGLKSTTAGTEIGGLLSNLAAGSRGMQQGVASAGRGGFIASTLMQGGEDLQKKNKDANERTADATEKLADQGLGIEVA